MRTVEIPDAVYEEAARRASARGESIEILVADFLSAYIDDEPLRLTPEQLKKIDQAEAEIDAGKFYTPEQVDAQLDAFRDVWMREHAH